MTRVASDARPAEQVRTVSVWNVANALTTLRILLVPVFLIALMHSHGENDRWRIAAAGVFFAASLTDRLDGVIARRWSLVTDFGKLADPIADKALVGSALVALSLLGELPWWITAVIIGRELGVTVLRFVVIRHGVISASRGGKAKTLLQSVAVWLYVLPLGGAWHATAFAVLLGATGVTVLTGLDYLVQALRLRRAPAA